LCLFAAFLANEGLRAQSISVYLSALRHLQISAGLQAPTPSAWPWLTYVLRGIKRSQAPSSRVRLPITASILLQIKQVWFRQLQEEPSRAFETLLLWATACLAFFGFLRLGELLQDSGISQAPLLLSDLATDSHTTPSLFRLHIRSAKNDPFGRGASISVGATGRELCPAQALRDYLAVRPTNYCPWSPTHMAKRTPSAQRPFHP
jgi:hypothetical protein